MGDLPRWLRHSLGPLRYALADAAHLQMLLRDLGFSLDAEDSVFEGLTAGPLSAVAAAVNAVAALADGADPVEIVTAVQAAARAVRALASFSPGVGLPPPLNDPATWQEMGERLGAFLVGEALPPALRALLLALDVLEPAVGVQGRPPIRRIHLDRLSSLCTDPAAWRSLLWRSDGNFDLTKVAPLILDAGLALGARPSFRVSSREVVLPLPSPPVPGIGPLSAEIAVGGAGSACVVRLGVSRGGEVQVDLGNGFVFDAALAGSGTARLTLDSGQPPSLALDGVADVRVSLGTSWDEPLSILGFGGDPVLAAMGFVVAFEIVNGKPRVEIGFGEGLRLRLPLEGFVKSLLPAPLDFTVSPTLAWSPDGGFALSGLEGATIRFPIDVTLGPAHIQRGELSLSLEEGAFAVDVSGVVALNLGAVQMTVERLGASLLLERGSGDGPIGGWTPGARFLPPTGIGLALDAGIVKGSGYLSVAEGRYAGAVALRILEVEVSARGLLETMPDGKWSLVAAASAQFPPIQLGYGFSLVGVGGLLGLSRTIDLERMRADLSSGSLDSLLFPPADVDPLKLIADLAAFFPAAAGHTVIAPMVQIGWGIPVLIRGALAVLLDLGSPPIVAILGRLEAAIPDAESPVLLLRLDTVGALDFARKTIGLDAALVRSSLLGMALTGSMALRAGFGDDPYLLLAVGGFHPSFQAPAGFPALQRVGLALELGENVSLSCEGYFAFTSNTVQTGASVRLHAKALGFTVEGGAGFDVLATLRPFSLRADLFIFVAVKMGSLELCAASLDATVTGPTPWHCRATARLSVAGKEVAFKVDVTVGEAAPLPAPVEVDVDKLLKEALTWREIDGDLTVRLRATSEDELWVGPAARLEVRQSVVPLELEIVRFGEGVPLEPKEYRVDSMEVDGVAWNQGATVEDWFAPGQFRVMRDAERLAAPSFEKWPCGAELDAAIAAGAAVDVTDEVERAVVQPPGEPEAHLDNDGGASAVPPPVQRAPERFVGSARPYSVRALRWTAVDAGALSGGVGELRHAAAAQRRGTGQIVVGAWEVEP